MNYIQKLNQLNKEIDNVKIRQQVKEIQTILKMVAAQRPLTRAPKPLGLLPDEFEEVLAQVGLAKKNNLRVLNHLLNSFRQFLSLKYGIWSLPNLQTATLMKEKLHVQTVLEVMAGNAYWTQVFKEIGLRTIATDSLEWAKTSTTGRKAAVKVEDYSAAAAIAHFRQVDLIFCSWAPNFGRSDLEAVRAWRKYNPQARFLFVGEKNGATNSPAFWQQESFILSTTMQVINRSFRSFDFIHEQIYLLK